MTVLITDRGAMTGRPDNTDFIQEAIDKLPSNETLRVPAGVFRIKANRCNQFRWGIRLKSNMCLQLDKGAELWALGTKHEDTNMILMQEASNVKITGEGMVRGERNVHQGQGGEHGHCIRITYGCKNIALENFTARDAWGDGIMIDNKPSGSADFGEAPAGVTINNVRSVSNRRQGLSVTSVSQLTVTNNAFTDIGGTAPGCGIDLECDAAQQLIEKVYIGNNLFQNNQGSSVAVGSPNGQYRGIRIAPNNYDMRRQPIWVSGAAGKLGEPIWAKALSAFKGQSFYRWWGYPTTWESAQ